MSDLSTLLIRLGVPEVPTAICSDGKWKAGQGQSLASLTPIDGQKLAEFPAALPSAVTSMVLAAEQAFLQWRSVPAPARGEFVRQVGNALRRHKQDLATLVTLEAGKIMQESLGEVQEMIDICDFAVGLSRQLYGKTIVSERPEHRLAEQWHPLGPIGVISAFNFPVAVWAWNVAIAWVCGDTVVWKPSEKTPLCALGSQAIVNQVLEQMPEVPKGISNLIIGDGPAVGQAVASDPRLPLISATGSVPMGRSVAQTVGARLGRSLLELGGNNAMIVAPSADLELATRAIVFSAVGTAGQRCTSLRRLIVHRSITQPIIEKLQKVYLTLPLGDPLDEKTLIGPLIDEAAAVAMDAALSQATSQGGQVFGGGRVTEGVPSGGVYVHPAIVEISSDASIVQQETFAPILYVMRYDTLDDAIAIHNNVPQGLASAIFTSDVREAERFCSASGSDCGIVNVNIGTSGAEIGGEKETGGGRESGSDAWKAYMRRATNTINYSTQLPLAQGIKFDLE